MPERRYLVSMASPMATWVRSIGAGWFGDCWLATEIKLVSCSAGHRRPHRRSSGRVSPSSTIRCGPVVSYGLAVTLAVRPGDAQLLAPSKTEPRIWTTRLGLPVLIRHAKRSCLY
jgi:hypothetical protein